MMQEFVLDYKTEDLILNHAAAEWPSESCGLVVRTFDYDVYLPCRNAAADDAAEFEISADDWLEAEAYGEILAVVHSHPQGEPFLSGADRQMQRAHGLPWALAVGGVVKTFRPVPHLRGRTFEYGKSDCFTLIRDAFHLCGIDFRDQPRVGLDADASADAFVKNLPDGGFEYVSDGLLQAGDVILTATGGHASHAMLYLGDETVLHHALDQLSRREAYGAFWQKYTHSIWRHKEWQPQMMTALENDLKHSE